MLVETGITDKSYDSSLHDAQMTFIYFILSMITNRLCIPNFCSFLRAWRAIQLFKYTTSKLGLYTFDVAHCIVVFFPSWHHSRLIFSSRTQLICATFKKRIISKVRASYVPEEILTIMPSVHDSKI